jgi:hypothetical protein
MSFRADTASRATSKFGSRSRTRTLLRATAFLSVTSWKEFFAAHFLVGRVEHREASFSSIAQQRGCSRQAPADSSARVCERLIRSRVARALSTRIAWTAIRDCRVAIHRLEGLPPTVLAELVAASLPCSSERTRPVRVITLRRVATCRSSSSPSRSFWSNRGAQGRPPRGSLVRTSLAFTHESLDSSSAAPDKAA